MGDSRCDELLRISGKEFERFRQWKNLCQDTAENFYPIRASFTRTLNMLEFAGDLMDGTPVNARETLGNAINAMLRQGQWFHVGTGDLARDKRPANAVSLNRATNALNSIIEHPQSNWTSAMIEADMDWVSFGAYVMSIEESAKTRDHLVFKPWHLAGCAWMLNEDGRVDTMFRDLTLTARDIYRRFMSGSWTGTMAPSITRAAMDDPGKEIKIRHILMPTEDLYGSSLGDMKRIKHPFNSIYIDLENRTYLNELGAPVFNYVVGRNRTLSGMPFGFSPMSLNSIQDARMLQDMALVILEQGQKAVDPPTIGAGNVFTRDMNFFSGGHTEVDLEEDQKLGDVFTTVETGNVSVGLELKQDVRSLIAEAWLLNKLMLPTLRDMRELEVQVRTDEFRRAALPFFQPIESNHHGEVLGTTFDMGVNMGVIRPGMFPAEMQGKGIGFTYDSPLNDADGVDIVNKYYQLVNIAAAGAKVDATVTKMIDIRQATEDAISQGTKPEWLVPDDQRAALAQQGDVVNGLAQAADIGRQAAGVTADLANAHIAAQQAGLAPPPQGA